MKRLVVQVLLGLSLLLAASAHAVPSRAARQEARIRRGERSGELTPREANRLERQQARIHRDRAAARADGRVTPRERARINREENRASRAIFREKHDRQRR